MGSAGPATGIGDVTFCWEDAGRRAHGFRRDHPLAGLRRVRTVCAGPSSWRAVYSDRPVTDRAQGWLRPANRSQGGHHACSRSSRLRSSSSRAPSSRSQLRGNCTAFEQKLWLALRELPGPSFKRQVVVLGFIADFLAPSERLIVEVDGASHARRRSADARRDRKLARAGYRVLRLEAELVMSNLPAALARVTAALGL